MIQSEMTVKKNGYEYIIKNHVMALQIMIREIQHGYTVGQKIKTCPIRKYSTVSIRIISCKKQTNFGCVKQKISLLSSEC